MKRNTLNFAIDAVSALVMLGMVCTGVVMRFVLPPGSGSRRLLLGWGRHDWGDLHTWLALGVGAIVVVHVALHWQWVCVTLARLWPFGRSGVPVPGRGAWRRNVIGLAFVIALSALVVGMVYLANANVQDARGAGAMASDDIGGGQGRADRAGGASVQGWMSLTDISKDRAISVEEVRHRLGLPSSVAADERLGRLVRQYGFTMQLARQKLGETEE